MAQDVIETLKLGIGLEYTDITKDVRSLKSILSDLFKNTEGLRNTNSQLNRMALGIKQSYEQLELLNAELKEASTTKVKTPQYSAIEAQMKSVVAQANALEAKQKVLVLQGKEQTQEYKQQEIELEKLANEFIQLDKQAQQLVRDGKDFAIDTDRVDDLKSKIGTVSDKLKIQVQQYQETANKLRENVKSGQKMSNTITTWKKLLADVKNGFVSILKYIKAIAGAGFKKITTGIRSLAKGAAQSAISFKQLARTMLGVGLGVQGITAAFRKMISFGTKGFTNLVGELNQGTIEAQMNTDLLRAKMTQLQNAIGAMAAPLFNQIAPIVSHIVDLVTQAFNQATMFLGALTGQKTVAIARILGAEEGAKLDTAKQKAAEKEAKAEEKQAKAAEKLAKAQEKANKQLESFDELNNLTSKDIDTSALDSLEDSTENAMLMFEVVEVPNKFADMVNSLKEMWKNANFFDLGKSLGTRIKEWLDDIPWDEIKSKIAQAGKSIASFLNGLLNVKGLGYSFGHNLAEVINSVFTFIHNFVTELDWKGLGEQIAGFFNGLFDGLDYDEIYNTVMDTIDGVTDAINAFIDEFDWDNLSEFGSNVINTIADGIYNFFTDVKWKQLGENLGLQLHRLVDKINWRGLGRALGSIIKSAIDFLSGLVKGWKEDKDGKSIKTALEEFFEGLGEVIDLKKAGKAIALALAGAIAVKIVPSLALKAVGTIISNYIGSSASKAILAEGGAGSSIALALGQAILLFFGGMEIGKGIMSLIFGDNEKATEVINDRWKGVKGTFQMIGDTATGVSEQLKFMHLWTVTEFAAMPRYVEGLSTSYQVLDDALKQVDKGYLYTTDDLNKMRDEMGLSAEDIETIRQAMFDNNEELRDWADSNQEFWELSAGDMDLYKTILEKIKDGHINNQSELDTYLKMVSTGSGRQITLNEKVYDSLMDEIDAQNGLVTSQGDINDSLQNTAQGYTDIKNSADSTKEKMNTVIKEVKTNVESLDKLKDTSAKSGENVGTAFANNTSSSIRSKKDDMQKAGSESIGAVKTGMESQKRPLENAVNGIKDIMNNIFTGLYEKARNPINSLLRAVENMINGICDGFNFMIGWINNLQIDIPDWVPKWGGNSIHFNLGYLGNVNLPRLAQGQVIPPRMQEYAAILGDNNQETEVVSPLSTMKQAMIEALTESGIGGRSNNTGDIVVQIDGREVFRAVRNENNSFINRTGRSAFVY